MTVKTADIGINPLGGPCVYLGQTDVGLRKRKSPYDRVKIGNVGWMSLFLAPMGMNLQGDGRLHDSPFY
jgi:hypothetical protein